jgi:hypothetical protein
MFNWSQISLIEVVFVLRSNSIIFIKSVRICDFLIKKPHKTSENMLVIFWFVFNPFWIFKS